MRTLGIGIALCLAGCGEIYTAPRAYLVGGSVCVAAEDTVDLGAGSQAPAPDALPGCRTWPSLEHAGPATEGMCGPCGYAFDRATTLAERASRPDACCYAVSSPPPPG